jgi:hypothetical protein
MKTKGIYSRGTKDSNTWEFKRGKRTSRKRIRTWEEEKENNHYAYKT